jgi:hypothetical protein
MGCKTCGGAGSRKGPAKPAVVTYIVTLANGTQVPFGSSSQATVFAHKNAGAVKHKVENPT